MRVSSLPSTTQATILEMTMAYLHEMLEMNQDPERNIAIQAMKNMLGEEQLCVFRADSIEFITSDAPVVNVYGNINGLDYDLIGLPVSPKYFVAFIDVDRNVSNKVFVIDNEQTMSLNKHQYDHSATSIIMSKSKDELEKHIADFRNSEADFDKFVFWDETISNIIEECL